MPTVRSVSDITNILSSIIQEPMLQDVKVQGEVLVDGPQNSFFLRDGGNRLRCFIPGGAIAKFKPLLKQGNTVIVDGKITLFPRFSQYQIRVSNIQNTPVPKNAVSVTKVTNEISCLVTETLELQNIRIQGKVLAVFSAAVSNWDFCDVGGPPDLQIKCVHPGPGSIGHLVPEGDNVCVRGSVSIYPSQSRYQIDVASVGPITENSPEQCQCSGCDRCGSLPQCNRPRKIANFESCATCLPYPSDELYALCPECYKVSDEHETKVAAAVYDYFNNKLQVNGFSPYKECHIQFGTRNGKADVVLADENGSFAAIAECKGAGYVGHGIKQLKSYLSATDTRFGVFANRADSSQWKFYENRRRNQIVPINRSEFRTGVVNGIATRERLKDEIIRLENQISELDTTINQITQTKHNLTERTSNLTQQIEKLKNYKSGLHEEIYQTLDELVEKKIQRLEIPLSDLRVELRRRGIVNWFKNLFSKENE